ncbi:MAG: hypothetical protein ABH816_00245 [Candidatus Levyibacteriota bacterium]
MKVFCLFLSCFLFLVFIFSFFSLFIKPVFAAITFTISNPQSNDGEVTFDISITGLTLSSCPNTTCFLQAAFTPQAITQYFGYTKNHNGEWFEYVSSPETDYIKSTFFAFEPQSGNWSGTLTIRPDITDSNYTGTNTYNIKAWRYTGNSRSYSGSSDNVSIELTAPTPKPTITLTPSSTDTPSTPFPTVMPSPTPTKSPTLTLTSTKTPTPKITISPTKINPSSTEEEVLGESSKNQDSPVISVSPVQVLSASSNNLLPKILIGLGVIFLASCGILAFREYKKNRKDRLDT